MTIDSDNTELHKVNISVVLPVYNGEKYLGETIESILHQTYTDFEFIIVDDVSTDNSRDIIEEYATKDKRIKVFSNPINQGIAATTNFGIEQAIGAFIALTDQDDISFAERLSLQISYFETHPDIDILGAQIIYIDQNLDQRTKPEYPVTPGLLRWGLIFGCPIANSVTMMRRKIFSDYGYRFGSAKTAQDYQFYVLVSECCKMANLSQVLQHHREHEHNVSKQNFSLQQQEAYEIIRSHVHNLINVDLPDEIISGLLLAKHQKKHHELRNVYIAYKVSYVLTKLMRAALRWDLTDQERFLIKQNTASRLRRIWREKKYHFLLLPIVVYTIWLDPDIFIRKIKPIFSRL